MNNTLSTTINTRWLKAISAAMLAAGIMATTGTAQAQYGQYAPPPPPPQYGYAPRWDVPPQEFRDFQRRGFLDGVQGAQRDFQNHRIWDVNNRDEFRKPHVPFEMRGEYREGFKRGYYATVRHFEGARDWR